MSYAFPPPLDQMVRHWIEVGPYASEDEVLVDAMLALEDVQSRQDDLRSEIQRRLAKVGSALSVPLDRATFKATVRRKYAEHG